MGIMQNLGNRLTAWAERVGRGISDSVDHPEAASLRQAATSVTLYAVCGIVFAWLSQPLMGFADPSLLAVTGALFCISQFSLAVYFSAASLRARVRNYLFFVASLLGAGVALLAIAAAAFADSRENEERCKAIQADMLSVRPRRADGPALFEALKCRPQGGGTVEFPEPAPPAAEAVPGA